MPDGRPSALNGDARRPRPGMVTQRDSNRDVQAALARQPCPAAADDAMMTVHGGAQAPTSCFPVSRPMGSVPAAMPAWVCQVLPWPTLQALPLVGRVVGIALGTTLTGVYGLPPAVPGAGRTCRLG